MVYNQQNNQLVVSTFAHDASFTQALSKLGQKAKWNVHDVSDEMDMG